MAKVVFGGGIAAMSGKMGGQVASRNRGGAYLRQFVKPTQPHSPKQEEARSKLAAYSGEWRTLTDAQREAWRSYAGTHPILDRLGASIVLTGAQAYVKANTNRDNAGDATLNSTVPGEPEYAVNPIEYNTLTAGIDAATIDASLTSTAAEGQVYIVYAAAPVSAGVTNTVSEERMIGVYTLIQADIDAATFPNLLDGYVDYFGAITGSAGLRCTVAFYQYSQGQLGVPNRQSVVFAA